MNDGVRCGAGGLGAASPPGVLLLVLDPGVVGTLSAAAVDAVLLAVGMSMARCGLSARC